MLKDKLISNIHNTMREMLQNAAQEIMQKNSSFIIWGAGNTGRETLRFLKEYSDSRLSPKYIVDNNKSLWGVDNIKSPKDFFAEHQKIDVVLVCVYVADQVVTQIKENGYFGKIIPVSMSLFDIDENAIQFYNDNMDNLEKMYSLLADERSRETVEVFLNVLRSADVSLWENVNGESTVKLLDPEVLHFSNHEHFVDVGAFTGDTISKFLELCNYQYQSIVGFEPDSKNFSIMQEYALSENLDKVSLFNMATGAENGTCHFIGDCSESCVLSENGGTEVGITTLDSVAEVQDMTLLKISANGRDLDVLKGAEHIIKKNKPQISAYASGTLLWEIPFYLHKIVPEYKIYFRHYGIGRQAMICYAISGECQ